MKFRVSLDRICRRPGQPDFNPFLRTIDLGTTIPVSVRVWEFEAENEAEVRAYYEEAISLDLPYIRGYTLRDIQPIIDKQEVPINATFEVRRK